MAPTPETIEPSVPMDNGDADKTNTTNQYTNRAFITDEGPDVNTLKEHPLDTIPSPVVADVVATPKLDFDDILPHIGEFGSYQKILFFLMIPFAFFIAFVYFSQIFLTLVPEKHWCRIDELEHMSVEQR